MKKIYSKLYSRDSTGKIREWCQEQDGARYRTISGVQGGAEVISEWTVCEGKNTGKKNQTTAIEQATVEIEAKYKKQLKTGYFSSIKDIDKVQYVEPMLAKKYKDYADKIDFSTGEWSLQCKFNGNRCIITKDGAFSRKGERYVSVPHIIDAFKSFFSKYPNAVLDGELFNNDLRQQLNEIAKMVRKTVHITAEDLKKSEQMVKYYCYDGYNFTDELTEDVSYSERKEWIDKNVVGKVKYVEYVKTIPIKNNDDLNKHYQSFVDDGQEGGMLRNVTQGYEHKRSKGLLKHKPEDDSEGIILDIMEGNGNWSGTAKTAKLKWKGKTFDATFKGSYEELQTVLKNKKDYIGMEVTFQFNGLTGLSVPNFARIDLKNCIKTDR